MADFRPRPQPRRKGDRATVTPRRASSGKAITPARASSSGRVRAVTPPPQTDHGGMDPFQALIPDYQTAQELEEMRAEVRNLRRLQETIHFLNGAPDVLKLRDELLDLALSVSGLSRGMLALLASDDDGVKHFKVKATRGFEEREAKAAPETKVLRGILNRTLERREPLIEGDIREDGILGHAKGSGRGLDLGAVVCLPLEAKGELRGAVLLDDPDRKKPFSSAEEALLRSFAKHAGQALERVSERTRYKRRLERLKRRTERLEAERDDLARRERREAAVSERLRVQSQRLRSESGVRAGEQLKRLLELPYAEAKRRFTRRYLVDLMRETGGDLRVMSARTQLPLARLIGLLDHLGVHGASSDEGSAFTWGESARV